jgi:chromate transporter
LHGALGAAAAVTGLLAVPFVVVLAISTLYAGAGEHAVVTAMLDGVAAMVIGLTFATGLGSLARGTTDPAAWIVATAAVFAIGVMRWPLLPVIATLAPVSVALALVRRRR